MFTLAPVSACIICCQLVSTLYQRGCTPFKTELGMPFKLQLQFWIWIEIKYQGRK